MDIIMPKMGESVMEGTILKWHKKAGDFVRKDEILFEISTDKVDTEIPAQEDGILVEIFAAEGDTFPVNAVVARFELSSGDSDKDIQEKETRETAPPKTPEVKAQPKAESVSKELPADTASALVDVQMPKMGESVMEGTVLRWLKKIGEKVMQDEILFEISTDKVDTEVPSPAEGVLSEILTKEQETVPVGTIVARLSPATARALAPAPQPVEEISSFHDAIGSASRNVEIPAPVNVEERNTHQKKREGNKFYTPLVLSIAGVEGVSSGELELIQGTGADDRVTKKDLLNYLEERKKGVSNYQKQVLRNTEPVSVSSNETKTRADIEQIPMDNIRQKIMQHMINSRDTSVHVAGVVEVDMGNAKRLIELKKDVLMNREGVKLTYTSLVAYAAVRALTEYPLVNSSIRENSIIQKRSINLGIAVALEPNGLIVPNIKNAQEKNLTGLARAVAEMASRARTKKLSPDDISGGTFSITNYGVFGTLIGTPVINQPEVAILGMGAVVKRAVVLEQNGTDVIAIKPMMYLTLSHDHRLVDGMLGGKFLWAIKNHLERLSEDLL